MAEEVRVEHSVSLFIDLHSTIQLEKDQTSWKFKADVPKLNVNAGDHLISIHRKNKPFDIRNLSQEQFDPILNEALAAPEKYFVLRIVRGNNPNSSKLLSSKTVSLHYV